MVIGLPHKWSFLMPMKHKQVHIHGLLEFRTNAVMKSDHTTGTCFRRCCSVDIIENPVNLHHGSPFYVFLLYFPSFLAINMPNRRGERAIHADIIQSWGLRRSSLLSFSCSYHRSFSSTGTRCNFFFTIKFNTLQMDNI